MAQLLDLSTNEVVDVPDAEVGAAVASGRFSLPKGTVEVRDKLGRRGTIDSADAASAFAGGYSFVSPGEVEDERLEREYGDRDAAAFGVGLARGATLGLSDQLATATGLTTEEGLRELKKRNETASTVGEVVGTVAPAFIPGGQYTIAGAVTRGATQVGARVATGAATRAAVAGALEGGAYGLGTLITEEAMGAELTGQKVLAEVGTNALLGGAGGFLLGGLEAKLRKGASGGTDDMAAAAKRFGLGQGQGMYRASDSVEDVVADYAARRAASAPRGATDAASVPGAPSGLDDVAQAPTPATGPAPTPAVLDDVTPLPDASNPAREFNAALADDARAAAATPPRPPPGPDVPPASAAPGADARNPIREGSPSPFDAPEAATPPPGGAGTPPSGGGGKPPGGGGDEPFDPMRAFDELVGDEELGAATRKTLEEAVERNQGRVQKLLTDLGLDWPTAETWVLRDLDFKKAARQRLREKGLDTSAPRALLEDPRYAKAVSSEDKVQLIATKREEAGKVIGDAVKRFDAVATPEDLIDVQALAKRVEGELLAPLRKGTVDERRTAARVKRELDALLDRARVEAPPVDVPVGGVTPPASRPQPRGPGGRFGPKEGAPAVPGTPGAPPASYRQLSFSEAEEVKRALDRSLKWDATTPNLVRDELRKMRGILNVEIETRAATLAKRAGPEDAAAFKAWKDAKKLYGHMAELEDEAAKRLIDAKDSNRFLSLTDNIAGAAAFATGGFNPVGIGLAAGAAVLNKWGRERLPHLIALQMHRASKGGPSGAAARALHKVVRAADDAAAKAGKADPFGEFSEVLRKAAVKGEAELFAVHSALSADEGYRQTMQTAAGLDYSPEATSAAAARTERLRAVQEAASAFDAKVDASVTAFLSGTKKASPRVPGKAALARAERVAQLAADPAALQELLTTGTATLGETAPATSSAVMEAAQRAVAFLADKAPRPPPPALDVPALRRPFRPADAEVARFARYVAAVESPAGVLEDMAAGAVTAEAVEALRTVYPALYADVRERLVQRLAEHGSALDYRQRLSLGLLLDIPADPSLSPATIARMQQVHAAAEPQQPRWRAGPSGGKVFTSEAPESDRLTTRRSGP